MLTFTNNFIERPVVHDLVEPCQPSPCGLNAICRVISDQAVCSCLPNYIGRPPSCRPECTIDAECSGYLACVNEKCRDPCPGACGAFATCRAYNHRPVCTCIAQYTGDPFAGCYPIPIHVEPEIHDPCHPSPCGVNAICKDRNGAGSCSCLPQYFGDPYIECRPECLMNSDCVKTKACVNLKCKDPCPGVCGINAECYVTNHAPYCICLQGYTGNPSISCYEIPKCMLFYWIEQNYCISLNYFKLICISVAEPSLSYNPCIPSPCGLYSQCINVNGHAVCSCLSNYIGTPPACRPECTVSSECQLDKSCVKQKCVDPCLGTCGINANCHVTNHNPICSCPGGHIGDPFNRCFVEESKLLYKSNLNYLRYY